MRYKFEGELDWCDYVSGTMLYPGTYSRAVYIEATPGSPVYVDYVPGNCFFYFENNRVKLINNFPYQPSVATLQVDTEDLLRRIEALETENELLKDALLEKGVI